MGDDTDMIPVRDHNRQDGFVARSAQQRSMVAKWSRDDLEDKYLRLYEESLILKRHARKQEDKIKKMATKLLRLVSDKKREQGEAAGGKFHVETEDMVEELQANVRDLTKQNAALKERLMLTKQQLQTTGRRGGAYGHVTARINTGRPRASPDPRIAKNMRVSGPVPMSSRSGVMPVSQPRFGHSVLEETRAENRQLEGVIEQLHEQMNMYDQDIELLKEQMRIREAEYEEDLLKLKQQMSAGQRVAIQENIDVIKLQREVKEKSTRLTQLQGQYQGLEEKLRVVRASHDAVLGEMEKLNGQLQEEQAKVLQARNQLSTRSSNQRRVAELQERLTDMERECEILRDANEKLVSSAFDMEREREWRQRENALKVQIAQLEATLHSDVGEKGSILDKLTDERQSHDVLENEHRDLRIKFFEVKQECDDLKEKMKFFNNDSAVDFTEIEEALVLIKSRKAKEEQNLDFLEKVDEEKVKDYEKLVRELQAEHADTIHELEKTRNILIVQHKINKDYQMEVSVVSKKMEDNKNEYESKLEEYAQLLDIRAARIRKLENQLRDVAYGTKQYKLRPAEQAADSDEDMVDESVQLERGQNLFEIHIKKIVLSVEGLEQLGDPEPSVFATWAFYEYEIQATPVLKGPTAEFQFTSQYLVKVDDFFLHYLQKDSTTLELHQSLGTDYRTVAACQLSMRSVLDAASGRCFCSVPLTGLPPGAAPAHYGTVEYWVRLRVPMAQSVRLYKERSKALGYMQSNQVVAEQALEAMDDAVAKRPPDNINELHIKIKRCDDLKARCEDLQPSPFAVYKFFDYLDHDTSIVPGSNNPQFNDHKMFPVPMTMEVDKYLKASSLHVYVFDDTDPDETSYIGVAKIPLLPLAHDKAIKGIFELRQKDETVSGAVHVSMKWGYSYLPPRASTHTEAQQLLQEAVEDRDRLAMLEGEQQAMEESTILSAAPGPMAPAAPITPVPRRKRLADIGSASATSTPARRKEAPPRPVLRSSHTAPIVMATEVPEVNIIPETPPISVRREPAPPRVPDPALGTPPQSEPFTSTKMASVTPTSRAEAMSDDDVSEISEGTHVTGESDAVTDLDDTETTGPPPIEVSVPQPDTEHPAPVQPTQARPSDTNLTETMEDDTEDEDISEDITEDVPEDIADDVPEDIADDAEEDIGMGQDTGLLSSAMDADESELVSESVTEGVGESTMYSESQLGATAASELEASNEMEVTEDKKDKDKRDKRDRDESSKEETITEIEDDPAESTMFGDKADSGSDENTDEVATPNGVDSEDTDIIVSKRESRPGSRVSSRLDNVVTITIGSVTINEGASILTRLDIQMLFVECRFLNVPLEETETPFSLPKPKAGQSITFNFTKVVPVDVETNYERRQFLASMLLPDDPEKGRVRFTIVSEPPTDENEDVECEDVGVAYVSLPDILKNGQDVINQNMPVYDVNKPKKVIGGIQLSFECLETLKAVKAQMAA